MQELNQKGAFITGGANGIGLAIAKSLARRGTSVAIADIDLDAAVSASKQIESSGGKACAVACDVTKRESFEAAADAAVEAIGPIHVLVNNAGAFATGVLEDTKRSDWEWLLEINVIGVVNGLQTFIPRMRAHGQESHIVNTASISGHIATPGLSIYTATKFAVVGLSETLRLELADSDIGISILCPGVVKTGLIESSGRHRPARFGGAAEVAPGLADLIDSGIDPSEVGERVAKALLEKEFYIFTHPALRGVVEHRTDEILSSY